MNINIGCCDKKYNTKHYAEFFFDRKEAVAKQLLIPNSQILSINVKTKRCIDLDFGVDFMGDDVLQEEIDTKYAPERNAERPVVGTLITKNWGEL